MRPRPLLRPNTFESTISKPAVREPTQILGPASRFPRTSVDLELTSWVCRFTDWFMVLEVVMEATRGERCGTTEYGDEGGEGS